jgi:hypothetical protein
VNHTGVAPGATISSSRASDFKHRYRTPFISEVPR